MKIDGLPPVPPGKSPSSSSVNKTPGVELGKDNVRLSDEAVERMKMDKIVDNILHPDHAEERMAADYLRAVNGKGEVKKERLKNASLTEKEREFIKKKGVSEEDYLLAKRVIKTVPDVIER